MTAAPVPARERLLGYDDVPDPETPEAVKAGCKCPSFDRRSVSCRLHAPGGPLVTRSQLDAALNAPTGEAEGG